MSSKFINGPVNVVRLKGRVDGRDKIVYLFMDIHEMPNKQTECKNIRSKDIKDYFISNFDSITKSDKKYDFLMEIKPTLIHKNNGTKRGRYVDRILKIFRNEFDPTKNKSVSKSKNFPNIQFHTVDIRDYLKHSLNGIFNQLGSYIYDLWHKMKINIDDIAYIKDGISIVSARIKFLHDTLYNISEVEKINNLVPLVPKNISELAKYTKDNYNQRIKNLFIKILTKYHHTNIQENIKKHINAVVKNNFNEYFNFVNSINEKFTKYISILDRKDTEFNGVDYGIQNKDIVNINKELVVLTEQLHDKWMVIHSDLMDMYLLRRLLDKDYITNAITYTGIYHSINCIFFLVKYMDFQITHYSYMKYDIDKVNNIINKSVKSTQINDIFFPKIFEQCSDMSNFPPNFT